MILGKTMNFVHALNSFRGVMNPALPMSLAQHLATADINAVIIWEITGGQIVSAHHVIANMNVAKTIHGVIIAGVIAMRKQTAAQAILG